MEVIHDKTIYVGENFTYSFGEALNRFNQELSVDMDLGSTADFAYFDRTTNSYQVAGNLVKPGYYRLIIHASEVKNGRTYNYKKIFYLRVVQQFVKLFDDGHEPPTIIDDETGQIEEEEITGKYL